jgi:large subunit ribosomal protein L23
MEINEIILSPVLTEKATNLVKKNIYTLKVNKKANKNQIKKALETLYKVKVGKIMTRIKKGKIKRFGRMRLEKKMPAEKIAYVKLISGSLDLFPKA